MRRITPATALVLLLAACTTGTGTDGTTTADPTTTARESTTTTTTTVETTTTAPTTTTTIVGSTEAVRATGYPGAGEPALLETVDVATDDGQIDLIWTFENEVDPLYEIGYVEPPILAAGSGNEIDVAGTAFLQVTVAPGAGVDLSGETARETFEGENRFRPDADAVDQMVETGDFENVLTWVAGLHSEIPFTVDVLDDPNRLVVTLHGVGEAGAPAVLGADAATCTNPDGFSISYPADWWVNDGSVTTECGSFASEPIDLEPATDISAPVSAFVDPVTFATAARPADGDLIRFATTIDGRRALRVVSLPEDGLYDGIEVTNWLVDIGGPDDERTLILTTPDSEAWDYERNQAVLDAMARSLDLADPGPSDLVAAYRGGGTPFDVTVSDGPCLTVSPPDVEACFDAMPTADAITMATIDGAAGDPIRVGLAGSDVFGVSATGLGFLPVPIGGGLGAWALPSDAAVVDAVDRDGTVLDSSRE